MSLVCTVVASPTASISWWYRGLFINNGSTMVSDIDMRTYWYRTTNLAAGTVKEPYNNIGIKYAPRVAEIGSKKVKEKLFPGH